MHPDDRFRKDYFEALGAAAGQGEPTDSELEQLAGFLDPYDPLITYFAHHELAELYGAKSEPDPGVELRCRLHMAWYGRSARPVDPQHRPLARIAQPRGRRRPRPGRAVGPDQRADAAPDEPVGAAGPIPAAEHADRAQRHRQEPRGPPSSRWPRWDASHRTRGIAADDCATRCTVLERSLVRPLETYRGRLLPHEVDETRKNKALMKKVEEATAE